MAENSDGNKDGNAPPIIDITPMTDGYPTTPQKSQKLEGNQLSSPQATDYLLPPQSATNQSQARSTPPSPDVADGWKSNPALEQVPTAPPIEQMDKVAGYENISFYIVPLPPPKVDPSSRGQKPQRTSFSSYPSLSEEQARDALLHHVAEHCCFGKKAAQEMVIRSIENTSAFHYTLETFGEKRETAWVFEPYIGQPIDSPINGLSPAPWDIGVPVSSPFKESKMQLEVPHTASIKSCHECQEIGKRRCATCLGDGQNICSSCGGSGKKTTVIAGQSEISNCLFCNGIGRRRCDTCFGHGQITCLTCNGKGQLKCFIQLTVTWKTHIDDFIVERTSLPDELIRSVSGQLAFEEEAPLIWPISHFPDEAVNKASSQLVQQHSTNYNTERVLRQRHRVRIVPVGQVYYTWNNKQDYFFVYGFENKVYAPNYPQKCCCGCSIL